MFVVHGCCENLQKAPLASLLIFCNDRLLRGVMSLWVFTLGGTGRRAQCLSENEPEKRELLRLNLTNYKIHGMKLPESYRILDIIYLYKF